MKAPLKGIPSHNLTRWQRPKFIDSVSYNIMRVYQKFHLRQEQLLQNESFRLLRS